MDVVRKVEKEEEEFRMKLTILEKDNLNLTFESSEANETVANTFRRMMISQVPTMAIDEINFFANDSALYDEVLAHRLGLIPLTTDLKIYNFKEECKCKGKSCPICQTTIILKTEGPKIVYAEELEAADETVKSIFSKMPLVKLLEGQKIKFEATAKLGIGKDHAKHIPGAIFYKNKPILKINNSHAQFAKFKDKYPKQAFNEEGKLDKELILKYNLYETSALVNKEILEVGYEKDKFIFTIESFGQLAPEEILEKAIERLNLKTEEFAKSLKQTNKIIKIPKLK